MQENNSTTENAKVTFTDDYGNSYEGEVWDNQKHGYGILRMRNGTRYEGNWKNGKREGFGVCVYPYGEIY